MQALQNQGFVSSDSTAMDELQDFLRRRRQGTETHADFAQIEQELHRLFVAAEREALGRELERFDLDVPRIEIDGERKGKREQAKAKGKFTSGPSGYQEVSCGTISFDDRDGERLLTRRMGRMPEFHKATLKSQLTAEIMEALIERPGLKVVKLADGAPDNWTYLSQTLPFGEECLDFYHASEHLSGALARAYGEGTPVYHKRFETLRAVLRDDAKGPDKVIQALCRLRTRYPLSPGDP